ncbi:phage tail tube protein [Oceanibaculum nanhaiense]|uniref:phage tail tube protein n=1 Tax=Oceanibaculum nanhaiense TaxID=1909734 RepID=UPI003F714FF8
MADSNRVSLRSVRESVWGETPASPAMTALRITGESLKYQMRTARSNEIRPDRMVADIPQVGASVSGDIGMELSYGSADDFLMAALFADDWQAVDISGDDIAADASGGRFTSSLTDFVAEGIAPGQWVRVSGFSNPGNNGFFRVTAVAADEIAVSPAPAADEASGATIAIDAATIRNGVTPHSFTLERGLTDVGEYFAYRGCLLTGARLNIQAGQIATASFGVIGRDASVAGASIAASVTESPASSVLNATRNVASIREGGAELAGPNFARSLSLNLANNLREQMAVGSFGAAGIGLGQFQATGQIETYFGSRALYQKFLDGSDSALSVRLADSAGNALILDLPRLRFTDADVMASGPNEDVMARLSFEAIRHPGEGFAAAFHRFAAV